MIGVHRVYYFSRRGTPTRAARGLLQRGKGGAVAATFRGAVAAAVGKLAAAAAAAAAADAGA